MLKFITDLTNPLLNFIKDDPVRPEIPKEFRVAPGRFIGVLGDDSPRAVVCVGLTHDIPATVADLENVIGDLTTAVFYTIWSYAPGAGVELLLATVKKIQEDYPNVTRFVTLSPKTEMARRFHIKNGAMVFRENADTINYEYLIKRD